MMPNFKDRKPAFAGGRSFFPVKNLVIIVSVVLMLLGWYSTRLVVAIIPEGTSLLLLPQRQVMNGTSA